MSLDEHNTVILPPDTISIVCPICGKRYYKFDDNIDLLEEDPGLYHWTKADYYDQMDNALCIHFVFLADTENFLCISTDDWPYVSDYYFTEHNLSIGEYIGLLNRPGLKKYKWFSTNEKLWYYAGFQSLKELSSSI